MLGPAGMGIAGLLTSTTGIIGSLTSFGLGTSAVKDIAAAEATGDQTRIATVSTVLRRWVWVTGFLGMCITLFAAPYLSKLTFGNADYTFPFIWISVSLLLSQLSSGQMVLLQGMRKIQYLAKANLLGSIMGLITTLPFYYLMGNKGIVPGIVVSAIVSTLICWYFGRKIITEKVFVSLATTINDGKEMLRMGFMISLSGMVGVGTAYILRIFITRHGGVDQVGLYNAGFAIINSYVGLVFTAMGTDYYPRLSAAAHETKACNEVVNQQTEVALLILTPIVIFFLVFINWIVVILYSAKFVPVKDMILWAALAVLLKAVAWSIGFIMLAKSANKVFLASELISNAYMLLLNMAGYYYLGLTGLGISFIITYLLSLVQVFFIAKTRFNFKFEKEAYTIFVIQFTLAVVAFLSSLYIGGILSYLIGTALFLVSATYSYLELDKRIGIGSIVKNTLTKFKK